MIRIDTIWLTTEHMDMPAGTETSLARVVAVFGAANPHCAYLFANRRANRMKVSVRRTHLARLRQAPTDAAAVGRPHSPVASAGVSARP